MIRKLLTVQEAADYLRVSRSTIWRWCQDGTFTSAFKIGRTWRIHRWEVEEIISAPQNIITTPQNLVNPPPDNEANLETEPSQPAELSIPEGA